MTDIRQKAAKFKYKCNGICNKTVKICGIYTSLEEAFEFSWSLFANDHNTLPKLTRRIVKLIVFAFETP